MTVVDRRGPSSPVLLGGASPYAYASGTHTTGDRGAWDVRVELADPDPAGPSVVVRVWRNEPAGRLSGDGCAAVLTVHDSETGKNVAQRVLHLERKWFGDDCEGQFRLPLPARFATAPFHLALWESVPGSSAGRLGRQLVVGPRYWLQRGAAGDAPDAGDGGFIDDVRDAVRDAVESIRPDASSGGGSLLSGVRNDVLLMAGAVAALVVLTKS